MEWIVSGYCKSQDQARLVMIDNEDDWEYDCDFPDCPFAVGCAIALRITEIKEENLEGSGKSIH